MARDKPALSDCHPHIRQTDPQDGRVNYDKMSVMDISTFDANLPALLGSVDTSSGFWGFDAKSEAGPYERHILVNAGWTGTDETYPTRNDFKPWEDSLNYSVRLANQDYANFILTIQEPISSRLY